MSKYTRLLDNSPSVGEDEIELFIEYLSPDKIRYPDAFLLLGALTAIASSDRYTNRQHMAGKQAINQLYKLWSKVGLANDKLFDQSAVTIYQDTMQNIFISQLYSVTGYVNAVNDRVKSNDDDDEYRDHSSYYDKGPFYDERD